MIYEVNSNKMSNEKIKHLEMIQGVISRMSSNSFKLKGWAITVLSALYAYYISHSSCSILIIIFIVTLLFGILDTYYLYLEKGFVDLFNEVRLEQKDSTDFRIEPREFDFKAFGKVFCNSVPVILTYIVVLGVTFTLLIIQLFI